MRKLIKGFVMQRLFKWVLSLLPTRKEIYTTTEPILNIVPSPPDERDHGYEIKVSGAPMPSKHSIEHLFPEVKQQGSIGSCGSFGYASALEAIYKRDGEPVVELSELYHYYMVRQPEYMGTFPGDSGQYMRTGLDCARKEGFAPEALWPYIEPKWNDEPDRFAQAFARFFKIKSYHRCWSLPAIKEAIHNSLPVAIGITVKQDIYWTPRSGDLTGNGNSIGGHLVLVCGFDDTHENPDGSYGALRFKNSWGKFWGDSGYGWISYTLLQRDLIEAWAIEAGKRE